MLKLIIYLLNKNKCKHDRIKPFDNGKYCPDCGKQIVIKWYLLRCNCCNTKRIACYTNGKIDPVQKFCTNCGEHSYFLEQINKPNYFDINFAVVVKETAQENITNFANTQVWIDKENKFFKYRLIPILNKV